MRLIRNYAPVVYHIAVCIKRSRASFLSTIAAGMTAAHLAVARKNGHNVIAETYCRRFRNDGGVTAAGCSKQKKRYYSAAFNYNFIHY